MARGRHERDLHTLGKSCIHGDQTFHCTLLQEQRILFNELISMAVADHEIEIALLEQMIFNSRHDQRCVAFADFWDNHADGVTPLLPKRPRQMIRPVVQFPGSPSDQFLCALRDRFCRRRAVDDERHCRLRESQMFCERLQTDAFPRRFSRLRGQGGFRTMHRVTCQLVSHNGPNADKLLDDPES